MENEYAPLAQARRGNRTQVEERLAVNICGATGWFVAGI
jgi:hypothetical protein